MNLRPLPDGITASAIATATVNGRRGQPRLSRSLTLDVVPPSPSTLALTSGGKPVQPGAILRSTHARAGPDLDAGHGWRRSEPLPGPLERHLGGETSVSQRSHEPGALEDAYTAGEAQRLAVELGSQDANGNQRWQPFGSLYVDGKLTPDYIALGDRRAALPGLDGQTAARCWAPTGAAHAAYPRPRSRRWPARRSSSTPPGITRRCAWPGRAPTGTSKVTSSCTWTPARAALARCSRPTRSPPPAAWSRCRPTWALTTWSGCARPTRPPCCAGRMARQAAAGLPSCRSRPTSSASIPPGWAGRPTCTCPSICSG